MKISTLNLVKKIEGKPIIDGITAEFNPGAINVIIGPNGAGKTTLLKILGGLYHPSSGNVFYDGKSIVQMSSSEKTQLRRKIGFSFQEELFLTNSTTAENLSYPLTIRGLKYDIESLNSVLKKFGLKGKEDQNVTYLSGGQKKRLQMARALITNPGCILADEPTSVTDTVSSAFIENCLNEEAKRGTLVIITTHNLAQARKLSGKIFIMSGGKFIQEGNPDDIFSKTPPATLGAADFTFAADNIFEGALFKLPDGKFIFRTSANGLEIETASPYINNEIMAAANRENNPRQKVYAVIRPEDIFVSSEPIFSSARNSFKTLITELNPVGNVWQVKSTLNGVDFLTLVTKQSIETLNLRKGSEIYLTFKATAVHIIREE